MDRPRKRATASPRPSVTYYRSGNASSDSPFEKKVNEPSGLRKLSVRLMDIVLVLILIFLLIHSLLVKPDAKLIVNDTSYHSLANYKDSLDHYLKSFKYRNKISFNENSLVESLRQDYPEINAAAIELPVFSQKPVVRIQIARPSYFLQSGGSEYLIDSNGRIVAYKKQYPLVKNLPEIIDNSGFKA